MQNRELPWDTMLLGKYHLRQTLPHGPYGVSYQVELADWEMPLRLKKFQAPLPDKLATHHLPYTWQRWIACAGHPHLAHAYHVIQEGDSYWLVSEYVPGDNLRQYVERQPRLEQTIEVAAQLAAAIAYAHANRLYHGAIKPENIVINSHQQTLLTDFYGMAWQGEPLASTAAAAEKDLLAYGKILRYLFFAMDMEQSAEAHLTTSRFELPADLRQLVERLATTAYRENFTQQAYWHKLDECLANAYEAVITSSTRTGSVFPPRWQSVLPSRWRKENLHKHAFSYIQQGAKSSAERVWALASDSQQPSLSALWNWHLFYLREGIVSVNDFLRNVANFEESSPVAVTCAKGRLTLELGSYYATVLDRLQELRSQSPFMSELLRVEGEILWRLHRLPEALATFTKLLALPGCDSSDWYRVAVAAWEVGDLSMCAHACTSGLALKPTHPLLPIVQASYIARTGGWWEAERLFAALVREQPQAFWPLVYAAEFYSGQGIYQRSVSEEERATAKKYAETLVAEHPITLRAAHAYLAFGGDAGKLEANPNLLDRWTQRQNFSHSNLVTAVALAQDATLAASGDCEGNLYLWHVADHQQVKQLSTHHKHISDLVISDNGTLLLCGSWDHAVSLWSLPEGTRRTLITGHADKVSSVALNTDGTWALTGSWDGTARVWDIATGQQIAMFATSDKSWVTDVAFTADGKQALICDGGECMYLWDIATQKVVAQMGGGSVALTQDGKMAISSRYSYIECWHIPSGDLVRSFTIGHKETCLAAGGVIPLLLSRSEDDILTIWHSGQGSKVAVLPCEDALCAYLTHDARYLISGNGDTIHVWENILARPFPLPQSAGYWAPELRAANQMPKMIQDKLLKAEKARAKQEFSTSARLYQELQKIPGYENDKSLRCHIYHTGLAAKAKREGLHLHLEQEITMKQWATSVALALGGEMAVIASDDEPVSLWNLQSGYQVCTAKSGRRYIAALTLAQDGASAVIASWDGCARLRRLDVPGEDETLSQHSRPLTSVDMDATGNFAMYGTRAGEVTLCDLRTHQTTNLATQSGAAGEITPATIAHVIMTTGGSHAVSANVEGTVIVWDIEYKSCLAKHRPHGRFITALALAADGRRAASAARDNIILCWHAQSGEIFARLSAAEVVRGLYWVNDEWLLSLSDESALRLWYVPSAQCVYQHALHKNFLTAWDITSDARFLISASEDRDVKLWELEWSWTF
jgi:WD40 repeat protein